MKTAKAASSNGRLRLSKAILKSNRILACAVQSRRFLIALGIVAVLVLAVPKSASADGIDVLWLLSRVGGWRAHPILSAGILVGLMLINFLLNMLVLGIPTARSLHIQTSKLATDIAAFTLAAQVADRACAIAAFLLSYFIIGAHVGGEEEIKQVIRFGIVLNFIFSGLAVFFIAYWYLTRRRQLRRNRAAAHRRHGHTLR